MIGKLSSDIIKISGAASWDLALPYTVERKSLAAMGSGEHPFDTNMKKFPIQHLPMIN